MQVVIALVEGPEAEEVVAVEASDLRRPGAEVHLPTSSSLPPPPRRRKSPLRKHCLLDASCPASVDA